MEGKEKKGKGREGLKLPQSKLSVYVAVYLDTQHCCPTIMYARGWPQRKYMRNNYNDHNDNNCTNTIY